MDEDTKYVGVRVPVSLYIKLKKIAHEKETSLTEVAIESFKQYVSGRIPGLCPSCHYQNDPDARYCSECSTPLRSDAYGISFSTGTVAQVDADTISSLQSQIDELKATRDTQVKEIVDTRLNELLAGIKAFDQNIDLIKSQLKKKENF